MGRTSLVAGESRRTVPVTGLRRLVLHAQGYAARARAGNGREVDETIRRLTCVQLDSISVVERSHRIALASRVGAYPKGTVPRLLRTGRVFEYWAHEACLLPIEAWPLFKPAMERGGRGWYGNALTEHPDVVEHVLAEIEERGPLGSRHFDGATGGGMWNWKPAKRVLEGLWNHGRLVVADRQGFQRLYDLSERVVPKQLLDATPPPEPEILRRFALEAVRARGALTESGIVEHWRLRGGAARIRPTAAELVAEGRLERVAVDDGGAPVLVAADAELDLAAPSAAVLLSPFDNLLWDRAFARRVLGFDHLIEVYKPEPQRQYGYYVLPLLWRDRIVGRADLKSERREGELVLKSFHRETGVRKSAALDEALDRALARLARTIGLESVRR
jgi:uncharacterized protein YcaQ